MKTIENCECTGKSAGSAIKCRVLGENKLCEFLLGRKDTQDAQKQKFHSHTASLFTISDDVIFGSKGNRKQIFSV